jgi:hypothetical protein
LPFEILENFGSSPKMEEGMFPKTLIAVFVLSSAVGCGNGLSDQDKPAFAVAKFPTPVLASPNFELIFGGKDGKTLKLDEDGLINELELVAFKGMSFEVKDQLPQKTQAPIYKVTLEDFPYIGGTDHYIDSRFVELSETRPPLREAVLPSLDEIKANLLSMVGSRYIWGGTWHHGVPEMLDFYPPQGPISKDIEEIWTLKGVDCSGLLFEATDGYTLRNTYSLVDYGEGLPIEGLDQQAIKALLKPLDLVLWVGHVRIVLDEEHFIESRWDYEPEVPGFQGGVRVRSMDEVLAETLATRLPANTYNRDPSAPKHFVVRRWFTAK